MTKTSAIVLSFTLALLSLTLTPAVISKPSGQLIVATPSEPATLDPHKTSTRYNHTFNCNMFESLYVRNSRAEVVFGLAESVDISKDGLIYNFKLRPGVTFHDGSPFSAEDVKFSLERAVDPQTKNPISGFLKSIDKVEIVDRERVILKLKQKDAVLPKKLAYAGWIIPKKYFTEVGEQGFSKKPIGTGPFKFARRSINEYIELEANEGHWRWVPKIKTLLYKTTPEDAVRLSLLQTGDADIATEMPPLLLDKIAGIKGVRAISHQTGAIYWVVINVKDSPQGSPLLNPKVRRAMNYAVDKQGIIKGILNNQAVLAPGALAPSIVPPDGTLKPYEFNPSLAKKLLAEAGYPNGFKVDMFCPVGRYTLDKEISLAIADNLRNVGIDVNLQLWESLRWVTDLAKHYYPLNYQEFANVMLDPEGVMIFAIHSKAFWSYYSNSEVDKLIEDSASTYDEKERQKLFRRIDRLLYDDASHIFLWEYKMIIGVKEKLNWKPAPGDLWFKFWDAYWEK